MSDRTLEGRTALVTGGGSGIGLATAEALAAKGARIAIVDVAPERADAAARTIAERFSVASAGAAADVASSEEANMAHERLAAELGPVTVLVNCAGINAQLLKPLHQQPIANFDRMMAIHVRGSAIFASLCLPAMHAAGFGRIINISSILGVMALPWRTGYATAKHALIGMTRALALENARFGITVNAVAPGYILTSVLEKRVAEGILDLDRYAERTPVGRWGRPDEVARVIAFLCEPGSAFITGSLWSIDGGWTIRGDPGDDLVNAPGLAAQGEPGSMAGKQPEMGTANLLETTASALAIGTPSSTAAAAT